jgi:hypothetical protein
MPPTLSGTQPEPHEPSGVTTSGGILETDVDHKPSKEPGVNWIECVRPKHSKNGNWSAIKFALSIIFRSASWKKKVES